jgi:hypothetical protein
MKWCGIPATLIRALRGMQHPDQINCGFLKEKPGSVPEVSLFPFFSIMEVDALELLFPVSFEEF